MAHEKQSLDFSRVKMEQKNIEYLEKNKKKRHKN